MEGKRNGNQEKTTNYKSLLKYAHHSHSHSDSHFDTCRIAPLNMCRIIKIENYMHYVAVWISFWSGSADLVPILTAKRQVIMYILSPLI